MDKSSRTLLLLLVSSSVVLIIFIICIGSIYISQLHIIIWLYSSSHPLLVLNLIILLIIASSRFFAISRHIDNQDDLDQLMLPRETIIPSNPNSQAAEGIAEATLESTWKTTKEGSHLRQLKHSHKTAKDNVKPPEMLTDQRNDEVTSSASSSLSSAKLRKHVSLSKEEVNRRVERFIRKFNDD